MNTVENVLRENVENQKTPSVQYRVFNKDNVLYKFQEGLADIKHSRKVDDQTTYHAFSVTKTFTALAVLQLAERRMISLDERVIKHLPRFPYPSEITINHLLTHTSGIPNPMPLSWIHLPNEHESFYRDGFFSNIFLEHPKVKSRPNEKYSYSNLGYVFLGQLIEKISGATYEQYIGENILRRLNLQPDEMGFTIADHSQNAKGYHKRNTISNFILGFLIDKKKYMNEVEGSWVPFNDFYVNGPSYGGLIGKPDGFVKYLQELLKKEGRLLSYDFKKMLFAENATRSGKPTGMCLSWFKGSFNGRPYFAHAGGGGGYYCEIRIYPEQDLGSIIMFNRTGMRDERFLNSVDKYFLPK